MKNTLKFFLIRWKFHRFVPQSLVPNGTLKNLLAFSAWAQKSKHLPLNDFYNHNASYEDRWKLFDFIIKNELKDSAIDYFEFGVEDGATFKWWLQKSGHPESRFYGFDSFEGLPEDWGIHKKGSFSMHGKIPDITDKRGSFIKGLFQETLKDFLNEKSFNRKKVMLLDADLYSSSIFVLTTLLSSLNTDDILIFDEFNSVNHEFRAYLEISANNQQLALEPFAATGNYSFVAFRVERINYILI